MTDLLVCGGVVIDGTGTAGRRADVAVRDGMIEAVGDLAGLSAASTVDAAGLVVAPGFVDVHSHSDLTLLSTPFAHSKVAQGVTTEVVGNCGLSPAPVTDIASVRAAVSYLDLDPDVEWTWRIFADYLAVLDSGLGVNVAALVGHVPLRAAVAGMSDVTLDGAALDRLCGLAGEAMDAGAVGVSTGLCYAPAVHADEAELMALGATAAGRGKLFAWHVRDYADGLLDSVDQAIRVARTTGCRTQISHLVAVGRRNWGSVARALEQIDSAREHGADIGVDVYPYLAGNANLSQLLPGWSQDGGNTAMMSRLTDHGVRERVRGEWADSAWDWADITISRLPSDTDSADAVGRTITDLAEAAGVEPIEIALDFLAAHGSEVLMVAGGRSEKDLLAVLRHEASVIGSDGQALDPNGPTGSGMVHPRSYGTYPRLFAQYVRPGYISLSDAVAKCTSQPAARIGLTDRGILAPGYRADIAIFDLATIADHATYTHPHQYPQGISHVIVNGHIVVRHGQHTGNRPGIVIRGRHV